MPRPDENSHEARRIVNRDVLEWLLDLDPALRWQVERDIAGAPPEVWRATRARVATEGHGARLLALQDADGQWAEGAGQPWTATTWTLNALREWGVDAVALRGTAERLGANSRWEYDNLPYWGGEVDCCINGYTLANGAWLVKELLFHEIATGASDARRAARHNEEAYLPERHLMRRRSTGELLGQWVTTFASDGTWLQEQRYPGRVWFDVDVPPGQTSKWLTCLATRLLAWWDGHSQERPA